MTIADDKKSFRDHVAETMLEHISQGTAPWQKPWDPGKVRTAPYNPDSNKPYRGINSFWLQCQGRNDPRWLTYKQATSLGAQVREGEKPHRSNTGNGGTVGRSWMIPAIR